MPAPGCSLTPTCPSQFWHSYRWTSPFLGPFGTWESSLDLSSLVLISGFIYKRNSLMNLSLSPFGFRPLSRSASLNEISLLISEFNCPAPLECHNIHFSVFMLLYIPQLSLICLASLIFNLIFIKFILIAEMDFFNPLKFFIHWNPLAISTSLLFIIPLWEQHLGEELWKEEKI